MFKNLEIKKGKNLICDKTFYENMLMDVNVYLLEEGETFELYYQNGESALLLLTGELSFEFKGETKIVSRTNIFEEKPYCLHISKKDKFKFKVLKNAEILVQQKENDKEFDAVFYTPEITAQIIAGENEFEGSSKRIIRTIFDYNIAPYSNMVLGEVISYKGRWNSYPPHHHPQPEVYYYKFDHPNGFGVSVIGDDAAVIKNNSVSYIPGGLVHPQATAPGYRMFYVWMIPHIKNNPWTERIFAEEHKWLLEK